MTPRRSGSRRASIVDVATAAGVSRQTVSNVVNRPQRVRADTRARVQAVIDRMGYRPSLAARSLRAQRAGAVGMELDPGGGPTRCDLVFPLLTELVVCSPRHGCHVVPFASAQDRPLLGRYQDLVRTHLVDAFVLADPHPADPRPGWLQDAGVPFATFGRVPDDPSFTAWADVNDAAGTAAAVDHLVGRHYLRIGFLGVAPGSETGDERRRGWQEACGRHGLGPGPSATSMPDLSAAAAAADGVLRAVGRGGAVVCASDLLAIGALMAVQRRGWAGGTDVGVVGFGASAMAAAFGVTSLGHPAREIAEHLLGGLQAQLGGGGPPAQGVWFDPFLVLGATTVRQP